MRAPPGRDRRRLARRDRQRHRVDRRGRRPPAPRRPHRRAGRAPRAHRPAPARPEPLALGEELCRAHGDKEATVAWLDGLDPDARNSIDERLTEKRDLLLGRWPAFDRTWWPRTQERVVVGLAGGQVVLDGRADVDRGWSSDAVARPRDRGEVGRVHPGAARRRPLLRAAGGPPRPRSPGGRHHQHTVGDPRGAGDDRPPPHREPPPGGRDRGRRRARRRAPADGTTRATVPAMPRRRRLRARRAWLAGPT